MDPNQKGKSAQPESDPKLKMASAEIKAILDKYDVAGIITLHSPSHMELVMKLDPSYSVVSLDAINHLKIHPPLEVPGLEEERKERIAKTVNMLFNLRNKLGQVMLSLTMAEGQVRDHFGIKPPPRPQAPVIPANFNPKNGSK